MLRRSIQTLQEMLPYIPSLQTSIDTLTQLSSDSKEDASLLNAMSNLHLQQMFTPDIKKKFRENFTKAVKGYHLLNDTPIKEARWEDVNATILEASGFPVVSQNGSHVSGADLTCSFGSLSNKSMKYKDSNGFDMSSYRLTSVTSAGSHGTAEEIIAEIQKRKNFQYYSMIIRKELETTDYDWYLIPADHPTLDPASYQWQPMMGKTGKNKDKVIGWETNSINGSYMTITFSMSSQLWVHVSSVVDMEEYKMGSASSVPRKYNYIQLFERDL